MKKTLSKIPDHMVREALQIVNNYCSQSTFKCNDCFLRMKNGSCLIRSDFPERFDRWKKDKE